MKCYMPNQDTRKNLFIGYKQTPHELQFIVKFTKKIDSRYKKHYTKKLFFVLFFL